MAEHRDIVLHGNPAPPTPRGTAAVHIFSAHLYCSQPVGWIGMPLGKEVGLDPWDIVLHGNPAPPTQRGTAALPNFACPCLLWPNGWVDHDATR